MRAARYVDARSTRMAFSNAALYDHALDIPPQIMEESMNRTSMTLTLASSSFVVLYFGNRLYSHGADVISLIGMLLGAVSIGMALGSWQTRRGAGLRGPTA